TAGGALVLTAALTPRLCLTAAALRGGALVLAAWALFAALAPTLLGIDHAGLQSIYNAGDHTAFNLTLHSGARYPLKTLVPFAAGTGLLALALMRLTRNEPPKRARRRDAGEPAMHRQPALTSIVGSLIRLSFLGLFSGRGSCM
ncbi:MAG TPA: hypothetical protein VEF89_32800, partial [Solirubrobacteraceae bacterium]|nr:hypothetical protein [Solirubrobacteraceae bacterium]